MVIYKITNLVNQKIYIGKTTQTIEERFKKHWQEAKCEARGTRPNNYFHNALLKYGKENFKIEQIDTASSIDELNEKEYFWIEELNARNKEIGYNLMTGGQGGVKDPETCKKISLKKKENWQNEEIASKMREGLRKATDAWIAQCEEKRVIKKCEYCGKEYSVTPAEASKRKFCSQTCASKNNILKATEAASKVNKIRTDLVHEDFKKEVLNWTKENQELILKCPANKISTTLKDIENIAIKYGFYDWRTISKSICGNPSKKELLNYLKNCENICQAGLN